MSRSRTRRVRAVAVAVGVVAPVLAACGPPPPPPAPVTVTELGHLGGGTTRPYDIDDAGRVVGASRTADGAQVPFSWEGGTMTALAGATGGPAAATVVDGPLAAGHRLADTPLEPDPAFVWDGAQPAQELERSYDRVTAVDVEGRKVLVEDWFQYGRQAYVWEDGEYTSPPGLPGGSMGASDMNADGTVVGRSTRYPTEPYAWSEATGLIPLGTLGGDYGESVAVNDAGQVLGWSMVDQFDSRAFLWEDGVMTDLGALAYGTSSVEGRRSLSEAGHVVGTSYSSAGGGEHAFLWHEGEMTDLGTLGGATSEPVAVNSHGQVLGVSDLEGGGRGVFLWDDGVMTNLSALAAGVIVPVDINEAGQAIGYDPSTGRAVIWTATPD